MFKQILFTLIFVFSLPVFAQEKVVAKSGKENTKLNSDFNKLPTYIKANSLVVKSKEHYFVYSGNVEAKQGDMTMTSDILEGYYNEKNEIQKMIAKQHVYIEKAGMKGNSELATYYAESDTIVLTENPELQQEGSVLTADLITMYLQEDRSTAEGDVRVKMVQKDGKAGEKPGQ